MRPLAIELFAGSFGWGAGLAAAGWRSIGFDILHEPYHGPVPEHCELVLQDILTLHGRQFKDAGLIVASPPCEEFSRHQMPWTRARNPPAPRITLFDACFRIQREASEAADRYIPLVVENVREAQNWVGNARAHYGSRYLWGDVPALMPVLGVERNKESMSSSARALRAKIPFTLAYHIGQVYYLEGIAA